MAAKLRSNLLAKVNFPIYTLSLLSERHILVAGGGGKSKTGVPNVIVVYELVNNGKTCKAERIALHDTGSEPVMNCTIFHNGKHYVLAAGMDCQCQLYQVSFKLSSQDSGASGDSTANASEVNKNGGSSLRRRRRTNSIEEELEAPPLPDSADEEEPVQKKSSNDDSKKSYDSNLNLLAMPLQLEIQPVHSFQTQLNEEDAYQKVVRYSGSPNNLLLTGGTDGYIRAWKYPGLNKVFEVQAHDRDIFDLDIHPAGTQFVAASNNGNCKVFCLKNGALERDLHSMLPPSMDKYMFRNSRFGQVEGKKEASVLFTSLNPYIPFGPRRKAGTRPPSYILKWDPSLSGISKSVATGRSTLTAMAVSDDGRFVGVGDQDGSVDIYIAFSLQRIHHAAKSHNLHVSGLEFLPSCEESQRLAGDHDASAVSISLDSSICIHHIPKPATMGLLTFCLIFAVTFILLYFLLDYLNL